MNRCKLTQGLFSALVLAASSAAHARPMLVEPRDDVTFCALASKAAPGRSLSGPSFVLSGRSTAGNGHLHFGRPWRGIAAPGNAISLVNGTSPFGSNQINFGHGDLQGFGWDADSQASSNHDSPHDHEPVDAAITESTPSSLYNGAIDGTTFADVRADGVSPIPAVPEPSTYALLAAGLAGIALFTRHRRRGRR